MRVNILPLIIVVAILTIVAIVLCLIPGMPLNRHDWVSRHTADGSVFQLTVQQDKVHAPEHYCFDVCVRHGEWRPQPCQK